MELKWETLLSPKRIRNLYHPASSISGDHRTEFERDYDRAIYCSPFRRLHDKAQVFPLEPIDSIRTRLAHSLEVSTLARDIAREVGKQLVKKGKISSEQASNIETIAAAVGLLHDLGNPPFGHAGEDAIRAWIKDHHQKFEEISDLEKDFSCFEGNAQTIRLVSRLQILADFYGLNLTCGTLSALCKYTARSNQLDGKIHEKKKIGYFRSEEELIQKVRQETGTGDLDKSIRNPIAFLVEACDDICYSVVDVEDGLQKGLLSWEQFRQILKELCSEKNLADECISESKRMIEKEGSIPLEGKEKDLALIQAFRVVAIGVSTKAAIESFVEHYDDMMAGRYHGEIVCDSTTAPLIQACKEIGEKYIYVSKQNLKLELMGRKVIYDLLDLFWEGVLGEKNNRFARKIYALMSPNYKRVFHYSQEKLGLPERYCQIQLVTDYICGMTDTFACQLHKQITNG